MPQLDKVIFFSQFVHFVVLFFVFYAIMVKFILPNFIKLASIRQTIAEKEFLYYDDISNRIELMPESPLHAVEFGSILSKLKNLRFYHSPNVQVFYFNSLRNCFNFSSSADQTIHLFQKWFFFSKYNLFFYFKSLSSAASLMENDAMLNESNSQEE